MNQEKPFIVTLIGAGLLACATAVAQEPPQAPEPPATPAISAELERAAEARDRAADAAERNARSLATAEEEQRAALAAVEAARRELALRAAEERQAAAERRQRAEAEAGESMELRKIQQELERAHARLRKASREVAQVHRDLHRAERLAGPPPRVGGNRAVIGVILGENTDDGVRVIGVSPDGPAERAGLRQGDVIVSLLGEPLAVDGADARDVLTDAMAVVEPGDELRIVVDRNGERIERNITAEERTPFSWHSVTRLRSAAAPDAPVIVEALDMPASDREMLERELETLRERIEEERIMLESRGEDEDAIVIYEFEALSDIGDAALAGTNVWFGMSLTRGLKFAELDEELSPYFGTDQGVLVLKARDGNPLQLRSGDVIQAVDGTEVKRPADVMRALRRADAGESVELRIMRQQAGETLTIEIPEQRVGLRFPGKAPAAGGWRFRFDDDRSPTGPASSAAPAPQPD